jgi:protein-S-isoprenylcysteine O-methyltransferase Ste14
VVLIAGLAVFTAVSLGVRYHFRSDATSLRFALLGLASAGNIFMFGRDLWLRQKSPALLAAALALIVASGLLFAWAMRASRSARLRLIYDADAPQAMLRAGPFRSIRHPFYASYILFWSGCAIATLHPVNLAYAVLLVPVLVAAARAEERSFEASPLAAEYAAYRRAAGMFWPKLW